MIGWAIKCDRCGKTLFRDEYEEHGLPADGWLLVSHYGREDQQHFCSALCVYLGIENSPTETPEGE